MGIGGGITLNKGIMNHTNKMLESYRNKYLKEARNFNRDTMCAMPKGLNKNEMPL